MATIKAPLFKPDIGFKADFQALEEKMVIVHVSVNEESLIRIWPTTFLIQEDGTRKKLLQAYNITKYPMWKWVLKGHRFTLVFEGLDKYCLLFDLLEDIPDEGGFHVENIERNKSDVYQIYIDP